MSDVRLAPNIYQTPTGYRVFVRELDPRTGTSHKVGKRFGPEFTLEQLEAYRDARQAGPDPALAGFTADARRYLALEDIKAMPAYVTRIREIETWMTVFQQTPRDTIDKNEINDALHRLRKSGYAPSSCNKFRTALMSLWTTLDGRSAANPVRDAVVFEEAPIVPRGQSYELLTRILDAIPDERGQQFDRATLYRAVWNDPATVVAATYGISSTFLKRLCQRLLIPTPSRGYWTKQPDARGPRPLLPRSAVGGVAPALLKSRARLEVLAWTGMDPGQLGRMTMADLSFEGDGWYTPPARQKGKRVRRTPRIPIRLPMTPEAREAFRRLIAVEGLGAFNGASLLHVWLRACRRVERTLQKAYRDPRFRLPHIRLKDIRHSFGTKIYEDTHGDLGTVARMLGHAPGSPMTLRYSLGAVPEVLRTQMQKFSGGRKLGGGTA